MLIHVLTIFPLNPIGIGGNAENNRRKTIEARERTDEQHMTVRPGVEPRPQR
jgi:hypothetical protein